MTDLKAGDLVVWPGDVYGMYYPKHVAIVVPIFGEPVLYESTEQDRPPCVRTSRDNPKGVQAHRVNEIVKPTDHARHYALYRPLYDDEELRLLDTVEYCLGRDYEYVGGPGSAGFVAHVLKQTGVFTDKNERFTVRRLMKECTYRGLYKNVGVFD